ncbi:MAG TPA: TlpA disulfide reductase family protein [Dokdonella sp.]|uniref:TlpA family protein disulfide reductase n=1 Tax=Dokdonella sp. TaxID=2291710 RepID=UPI002D8031FC|nr:TlpA disulfide reductase family protein [Dokdonella sp.]HET9032124.1 TlpA disulfide reductase family protein [Dokdonella sp.]
MFNRTNVFIVLLALASAGLGLGLSALLRPSASPAVTSTQSATSRVPVLDIGQPIGEIRLPDRDGKSRQLSEWSGKLVVLNFWASWCGPCREEMPMLDAMRARYASRHVEVIGVAAEPATDALGFLKQNPVAYPILINAPEDPLDVSLHFGNTQSVLPYTALISRDGRLLATRMGNFSEQALKEWINPYL